MLLKIFYPESAYPITQVQSKPSICPLDIRKKGQKDPIGKKPDIGRKIENLKQIRNT